MNEDNRSMARILTAPRLVRWSLLVVVSLLVQPLAESAEQRRAASGSLTQQPSQPHSRLDPESSVAVASARQAIAGYIFGAPVPAGNYYFAKRVSYMFPHSWEEGLSEADRERAIWEALILHYESFRRGVAVSDEELEHRVNSVLKGEKQSFTRAGDPTAYGRWIKEKLNEDVELFENQMRYLLQIDKLKDQVRQSLPVTVTEKELQEEFLNEKNHVGGEMVTFDTYEAAQAFYEQIKNPAAWEAMKIKGAYKVRPISLMTLEAYMDLWKIPKGQMYAFHAMALGSVGPPMPFGSKQWCVYRLLEKRTGDLKEFPKERESYRKHVEMKKKYEALNRWINTLQESAKLQVVVEGPPSVSHASTQ